MLQIENMVEGKYCCCGLFPYFDNHLHLLAVRAILSSLSKHVAYNNGSQEIVWMETGKSTWKPHKYSYKKYLYTNCPEVIILQMLI